MSAGPVAGRLEALVGEVALPDGITLGNYDGDGFDVCFNGWETRYLQRGVPAGDRPVAWMADWGLDTVAAAARPDTSDEDLARLLVEDVVAAAVEAVAHEFFELAALRGRPLWGDAHPGAAATVTPRIVCALARRSVSPEV